MENQQTRTLPVPSLTQAQVQSLINYANDTLPTKYGKEILAFFERVQLILVPMFHIQEQHKL